MLIPIADTLEKNVTTIGVITLISSGDRWIELKGNFAQELEKTTWSILLYIGKRGDN